jgi:predicted PurR-regulated permease PerM
LSQTDTTQKRLGALFFYGLAILVVYLAFRVVEPFLAALVWAGVLVVVTYPIFKRLESRWKKNISALICTTAVTILIIAPSIFVLVAFIQQAVNAAQSIHVGVANGHYDWVMKGYAKLQTWFPKLPGDFEDFVHQYAELAATYLASKLGPILKNTAAFMVDLIFTIFAMFYFYRDGDTIVQHLRRALPFEEAEQKRIVNDTRELIFATVLSSLVAALVHGVLGGLAFAVTGIKGPLFWGVLMAFFSLIPVIGTALVWGPLSVSLMLGGHLGSGIALAIFCGLVVGVIDNFIRPILISGRSEMGTLLIFIGVAGGVSVFGLLGVVLGPIAVAMAAMLVDFYSLETKVG